MVITVDDKLITSTWDRGPEETADESRGSKVAFEEKMIFK